MNTNTKKMTSLAMLCAIAYIVMVLFKIPIVLFLKYEPKDVIITIGGFIYGPLASFTISFLVSFVEMFTVSDTGIIGCVMNILASCSFACTAAFIYKKKRTLLGAAIGLFTGVLLMTAIMLIWNYLVTPIFLGMPRDEVAKLLIPAILPFNLLKGSINMALTMLLYKPIVGALRKANLIPESGGGDAKAINTGVILISLVVLATCALFVMVLRGLI